MERLLERYRKKLALAHLAAPQEVHFGVMDDKLLFLGEDGSIEETLAQLFSQLSINTVLAGRPMEPYRSIIEYLARSFPQGFCPEDTETRTFLHELPVVTTFEAGPIAATLGRRKCVIVPGHGVVTYGTVSPEQAFVLFSSVCFATFVKFFTDYLLHKRAKCVTPDEEATFQRAVAALPQPQKEPPPLKPGPLETPEAILAAMVEAGAATVGCGLVDSYFGNISFYHKEMIYISQTGSSLDELQGHIDPVPMDASSCAGITASSELSAHREVYRRSGVRCILHGHPKFSVVLSMLCDRRGTCANSGECHRSCRGERSAAGLPIVPGEVGTGPYGLHNTLPQALVAHPGALVYGHGLFTQGEQDFNAPFTTLLKTENALRARYFALL